MPAAACDRLLEAFVGRALGLVAHAEDGARDDEVDGPSDLDVLGFALDEHDARPHVWLPLWPADWFVDWFVESLNQLCVVGAGKVALGVGPAEQVGLEHLRRLRHPDALPRNSLLDGPDDIVGGAIGAEDGAERIGLGGFDRLSGGSLECVARWQGGHDRGVLACCGEQTVEQVAGEAWPGCVVDGDVRGVGRDSLDEGADGLVTVFAAASDEGDTEQGECVAVSEFEGVERLVACWSSDGEMDDLGVGAGVIVEGVEGSVQHGAFAEGFIELGAVAAIGVETSRGTGGGDEHSDFHGLYGRARHAWHKTAAGPQSACLGCGGGQNSQRKSTRLPRQGC